MNRPGKTLVIGAEGFLGKGFHKAYRKYYPGTIGTDYRSHDPRTKLDLRAPRLHDLQLRKGEYAYAIIVAANTNLARCELEKGQDFRLNVEGTLDLVRALIKEEIQPILLSTAYVFDGVHGGYDELSSTNPINEYGRQKEYLEKVIGDICGDNYLMIRCSKVFDLFKGGNTLLDQICSELMQGRIVRAAHNQIFNPILLDDLVGAVIALQRQNAKGLYNICTDEVWTRLDLVKSMADALNVDHRFIQSISLDEIECSFRLPKRTNMSCAKFHDQVDFQMTALSSCIEKLSTLYETKDDRHCELREAIVD